MSRPSRGVGRDALHLVVLVSFAVAQPLFSVLGNYPAFFAAHHISSFGLVAFALALVVVPALVLVAAEALAGLAGEPIRARLHLFFVGLLLALLALPLCSALPTAPAYLVALAIGAAGAAAYALGATVRAFVTALCFAPALFLVVFLFFSSTSKVVLGKPADAWTAESSFRPPVVLLQFDAWSILLTETPDHRIDPVRFPNLARLAHEAAWYRNVSNVHENTVFSIPSILTGRFPRKGLTPVVQDWGENLFTLLGPSHRLNVTEEATSLCPPGYCHPKPPAEGRIRLLASDVRVVFNHIVRPDGQRHGLPSTSGRWTSYASPPAPVRLFAHRKTAEHVIRHLSEGRIGRYRAWLGRIRNGDLPDLDFIHMFMPHEPREFLPDGRRYVTPDTALEGPPAYDERFLTDQAMQRVILQVGFTDRIVGEIVGRLKKLGIYDRAMIVLLADHGESFDVDPVPAGPFVRGHLGFRRAATARNIEDIASIPLFIKYPKGHGPRGADDRFVRSLDIIPTIAQVTGRPLTQHVDGTSLLAPGYRGHNEVIEGTTFGDPVTIDTKRWQARRERSLRRRLRLFGWGRASLFRFGPRRELVGEPVSALRVLPRGHAGAIIDQPGAFGSFNPRAPVCPCQVAGRLRGERAAGHDLAFVLNGMIVATGRSFAPRGEKRLTWASMLPVDKLRAGRNLFGVFQIEGAALRPLASAP